MAASAEVANEVVMGLDDPSTEPKFYIKSSEGKEAYGIPISGLKFCEKFNQTYLNQPEDFMSAENPLIVSASEIIFDDSMTNYAIRYGTDALLKLFADYLTYWAGKTPEEENYTVDGAQATDNLADYIKNEFDLKLITNYIETRYNEEVKQYSEHMDAMTKPRHKDIFEKYIRGRIAAEIIDSCEQYYKIVGLTRKTYHYVASIWKALDPMDMSSITADHSFAKNYVTYVKKYNIEAKPKIYQQLLDQKNAGDNDIQVDKIFESISKAIADVEKKIEDKAQQVYDGTYVNSDDEPPEAEPVPPEEPVPPTMPENPEDMEVKE